MFQERCSDRQREEVSLKRSESRTELHAHGIHDARELSPPFNPTSSPPDTPPLYHEITAFTAKGATKRDQGGNNYNVPESPNMVACDIINPMSN